MIPRGSESRQGTHITLVAVHTAEGATTALGLQNYLDQPGVEASYHSLIDDTVNLTYLPDELACWALLSGNRRAVQLCFCAFARWPRSEWLAHDQMLRLGAAQARSWCVRHGIPAVKLTPAEVGADHAGVMGHWDWTLGKREGTHTDPGPNFPWDVFINYINLTPAPPDPGPDPNAIPTMQFGERSENVRRLQQFMTSHFPAYNQYVPTGYYGMLTRDGIAEFQRRTGITGPDADGTIVGPRTKAQLAAHGLVW